MPQDYDYTSQHGTLGREHRANYGDIRALRREQSFLGTGTQRSLRMRDIRGNLLFRAYYRPY